MSLSARLKQKMQEHNISAHALEKQAGLKSSAVHNILYGRSKNPSVNLIQTIAETLNCTLADLLGEDSLPSSETNIEWKSELYIECLETVSHILKSKKMSVPRQKIINYVDEVYLYSLKSEQKKSDQYFAEWIITKK